MGISECTNLNFLYTKQLLDHILADEIEIV